MSYFSQLQRMLWKEYRSLRTIWIAVLALGMLFQLIIFVSFDKNEIMMRESTIRGLTYLIPLSFAVAAALQMFSGEKSDRTFGYLLFLPIRPSSLLIGKTVFAGLLAILMSIPMLIFSSLLLEGQSHFKTYETYGFYLYSPDLGFIWYILLPLTIYGLATVCSLVSSNAQRAIYLTAGLIFLNFILLSVLSNEHWFRMRYSPEEFQQVYFLILTPTFFLLSIIVARPWLRRLSPVSSVLPHVDISFRPASKKKKRAVFSAVEYFQNPMQRTVQRLFWKEWRTVRWFAGIILVLLIMTMAYSSYSSRFYRKIQRADFNHLDLMTTSLLGGLLIFSTLYPIFMYQGDHQDKRHLFMADRGISPGLFWFLKQIVWFAPIFLLYVFYVCFSSFLTHIQYTEYYRSGYSAPLMVFSQIIFIYSLCNFISFHSSKLYVSVLLLFLFSFLSAILTTNLNYWGIPTALVYLPLSFLLLITTFLRMPYWLKGENSRISWKWSIILAVLILPATYVAVLTYRVVEIPVLAVGQSGKIVAIKSLSGVPTDLHNYAIDWGYDFSTTAISEAEKSNRQLDDLKNAITPCPGHLISQHQYLEAVDHNQVENETNYDTMDLWKDLQSSTELLKWYEKHQGLIPEIRNVSGNRLFVNQLKPETWRQQMRNLDKIQSLLIIHAKKLESENKLTEALDVYLTGFRLDRQYFQFCNSFDLHPEFFNMCYSMLRSWINHPDQTPELLKKAQRRIEEVLVPTGSAIKVVGSLGKKYTLKKHSINLHRLNLCTYFSHLYQIQEVNSEIRQKFRVEGFELEDLGAFALLYGTTELRRIERLLQNNYAINNLLTGNMAVEEVMPQFNKRSYSAYLEEMLNDRETDSIIREYYRNWKETLFLNHNFKFPEYLQPVIEIECYQSELLTRIALKRYELEKGHIAETLEELVKEGYLKEIPTMPYLTVPMEYYPRAIYSDKYSFNEKEIDFEKIIPKPVLSFKFQAELLGKVKNKAGEDVIVLVKFLNKDYWLKNDYLSLIKKLQLKVY